LKEIHQKLFLHKGVVKSGKKTTFRKRWNKQHISLWFARCDNEWNVSHRNLSSWQTSPQI